MASTTAQKLKELEDRITTLEEENAKKGIQIDRLLEAVEYLTDGDEARAEAALYGQPIP